jgi:hypothetical protein
MKIPKKIKCVRVVFDFFQREEAREHRPFVPHWREEAAVSPLEQGFATLQQLLQIQYQP